VACVVISVEVAMVGIANGLILAVTRKLRSQMLSHESPKKTLGGRNLPLVALQEHPMVEMPELGQVGALFAPYIRLYTHQSKYSLAEILSETYKQSCCPLILQ
jgi:hypothetical protein